MGIAMLMAFATGCGGNESSVTSDNITSSAGENTSSSDTNTEVKEMRDISSIELIKEMKIGWCLGNTFDGGGKGNKGASPRTLETAWGNPETTKEMIDEVVKGGFNIIRIPVTWDWSTGAAPDYKISDAWLNRVQEVVDYAVDNDVFVILNLHHETWHYPTEDNYEAASDRLKKIWTQIGNRFAGYNEKLIFEGMNEPRVIGSAEEWNGGTPGTREIVNKLNFDFVETIRGLGGNNKLRHLMIPGYAASSSTVALRDIKLPENDDKIIVSVHAYSPYNFALNTGSGSTEKWVAKAHRADIDRIANDIKTLFIDKGVAALIGEFGAVNRSNELYRADWIKYYVAKMKEIGVSCVLWDNGAFNGGGENFGFFDRRTLTFRFPKMLEAAMEAAEGNVDLDAMIKAPIQLYENDKVA
ncbi:MAG: glycoside hydrolase family 5 protein [Ruminiclostridium sp.]|nr:glycoside hydrolase family 5 protein [Ruminiclostridium sp.]